MKYLAFSLVILIGIMSCRSSNEKVNHTDPDTLVKAVDPSLFLADGSNLQLKEVKCTLSNGVTTTCYEIISKSNPSDHNMGPWCPDNISDGAEAGGIWVENGTVYDVDGAFIKNMAAFYDDDKWLMYDENGDIYTTDTKEDCANAANPNVGVEYENFCVECLPSYVTSITQTYLIPTSPIKLDEAANFRMGGPRGGRPPAGDKSSGRRPDGPPPGDHKPGDGPPRTGGANPGGPSVRGIAFNGVRFDAPAPTDAILGAYTLAPFDDAGGHINLHAGYHYHAATGVSTQIQQKDGHAAMIGYAMDGHGIYAQLDAAGNEPTGLDACRGHQDEVRGYHYHVAAPGSNSFIDCLYGAYAN